MAYAESPRYESDLISHCPSASLLTPSSQNWLYRSFRPTSHVHCRPKHPAMLLAPSTPSALSAWSRCKSDWSFRGTTLSTPAPSTPNALPSRIICVTGHRPSTAARCIAPCGPNLWFLRLKRKSDVHCPIESARLFIALAVSPNSS